ncbi:hypothetical protein BDW22DRAFT_1181134 [Trametopsis cervina]|nr:hypothetical protein BDW22DRAFT_1181134 [Trametopsis cervina]
MRFEIRESEQRRNKICAMVRYALTYKPPGFSGRVHIACSRSRPSFVTCWETGQHIHCIPVREIHGSKVCLPISYLVLKFRYGVAPNHMLGGKLPEHSGKYDFSKQDALKSGKWCDSSQSADNWYMKGQHQWRSELYTERLSVTYRVQYPGRSERILFCIYRRDPCGAGKCDFERDAHPGCTATK